MLHSFFDFKLITREQRSQKMNETYTLNLNLKVIIQLPDVTLSISPDSIQENERV